MLKFIGLTISNLCQKLPNCVRWNITHNDDAALALIIFRADFSAQTPPSTPVNAITASQRVQNHTRHDLDGIDVLRALERLVPDAVHHTPLQ